MGISLSDLTTRLERLVPARSGVPASLQYEQAVQDAVQDYNERNPMQKVTTLSIVSGTADYTLPDDFLRVIRLCALFAQDGVLHSSDGLIPVSASYQESWQVAGLTLTLYPTPTYNTSRDLTYAAGHVLNDSHVYPSMTGRDASLVLLKAQAICLRVQARNAAIAGEMTEYAIGDERVKRAAASTTLAAAADAVEADYMTRLKALIGPQGTRSSYNWMGY